MSVTKANNCNLRPKRTMKTSSVSFRIKSIQIFCLIRYNKNTTTFLLFLFFFFSFSMATRLHRKRRLRYKQKSLVWNSCHCLRHVSFYESKSQLQWWPRASFREYKFQPARHITLLQLLEVCQKRQNW